MKSNSASALRVASVDTAGATTVAVGVAVASISPPDPSLFTARTWKVYSVPLAKLVTVTVRSSPWSEPESEPSGTSVQSGAQLVPPSALTRYWYLVMAAPPSEAGAVQVRVASAVPAVAVSDAGAPGVVAVAALPLRIIRTGEVVVPAFDHVCVDWRK